MKKTTPSFALVFICVTCAYSQHSLTNTYTGEFSDPAIAEFALHNIPSAYHVRLCTEVYNQYLNFIPTITVTNTTLSQTLESVMNLHTNYTWRYENQTESFYVYPKTNAITMMRCGSIAVTNVKFHALFDKNDLVGFNKFGIKFLFHRANYFLWDKEVSIVLENPYVWQVLDAICEQLPYVNLWDLHSAGYVEGRNYMVDFPFTKEYYEDKTKKYDEDNTDENSE